MPNSQDIRPFDELRDSGLLWLINASVLHPRGFALGIAFDADGSAIGWTLVGDGSEPYTFGDSVNDQFLAAERTLAARPKPDEAG